MNDPSRRSAIAVVHSASPQANWENCYGGLARMKITKELPSLGLGMNRLYSNDYVRIAVFL
jgi:hypothetical protein